jgi:hypothetical protein
MYVSKKTKASLTQLIEYYEDKINNLPTTDIHVYLTENHVGYGICNAVQELGLHLAPTLVGNVSKKLGFSNIWWFTTPIYEKRIFAIKCLQVRVNIMKALVAGEKITPKLIGE